MNARTGAKCLTCIKHGSPFDGPCPHCGCNSTVEKMEARTSPPAPVAIEEGVARRFRHKKRGTCYTLIGVGRAQGELHDEDSIVLYRGDDGSLWARHQAEFYDGRFEEIATPSPTLSEGVVPVIQGDRASDPAYMKWPALRKLLWNRLRDDEREDGDLVATRAETCAILAWAEHFDRKAQPRRDEEQRTFDIIERGAKLIQPGDDEVVFYLRIGVDRTQLTTHAGKNAEPQTMLTKAIEVLCAEREDVANCPAHRLATTPDPVKVREALEHAAEIAERAPELNMANYDEEQVATLNADMIELCLHLRQALAVLNPQESPK